MNTKSQSGTLRIMQAANITLFLCTVTVAAITSLIIQKSPMAPASAENALAKQMYLDRNQDIDSKYAQLLQEAKDAIEAKDKALDDIRAELVAGYAVAKDINVTESDIAYWLSEPKLMLGVNNLSGGSLLINFADRREMISVGERIDFKVDGCDCFLLLKSSKFGSARFLYACSPAASEIVPFETTRIIDANLN